MKKLLSLIAPLAALPATPLAPALAVNPDEVLDDPLLEARAREISTELRCVVCQNQSIDDSDAEIARDLRLLVRERLVAGDNDEQVVSILSPGMATSCCCARPGNPTLHALGGPAAHGDHDRHAAVLFSRDLSATAQCRVGARPPVAA